MIEYVQSKGGVSALMEAIKHCANLLEVECKALEKEHKTKSSSTTNSAGASGASHVGNPRRRLSGGSGAPSPRINNISAKAAATAAAAGAPGGEVGGGAGALMVGKKSRRKAIFDATEQLCLALNNLLYHNPVCQRDFRTCNGFDVFERLLRCAAVLCALRSSTDLGTTSTPHF